MAMKGIVHTTNILGAKPLSFISGEDLENGFLVMKSDLADGELQIYNAVKPAAGNLKERAYAVANPAWAYDTSRPTSQNEENFINPKGRAFRVYDFSVGNIMTVTDYSLTGAAEVGKYVVPAADSYKGAVVATVEMEDYGFVGKIISIQEIGYFYAVGQAGGASDPVLGTGVDGRVTMVSVEIIKNG